MRILFETIPFSLELAVKGILFSFEELELPCLDLDFFSLKEKMMIQIITNNINNR